MLGGINVNTDDLKYFIELAAELNFSRTAEKCFISQPTLSRRISSLEKEIGISLFKRTHNLVELTAEGKVVLEKAYMIIQQYDDMFYAIDNLKRNLSGNLKLRYSSYYIINNIYQQTKNKMQNEYPNINLQLEFGSYNYNLESLQRNEVDAIFTTDVTLDSFNLFQWEPIFPVKYFVILPKNHLLAERETIDIGELKDEKFISISRDYSPPLFDFRQRMCTDNGFSPNIVLYCNSVIDAMLSVSLGYGVSLMISEGDEKSPFETKAVPITGVINDINMSVVWMKNRYSNALDVFIKTVKECLITNSNFIEDNYHLLH